MSAMSDYLELAIANHIFLASAYNTTSPALTIHIGLFTAIPSDAGGGTEVSSAGGTNYSRVAKTAGSTHWQNAAGVVTNKTAITFGTPQANWGTVQWFGIFDGSGGGANLLFWGQLSQSRVVNNGDVAPVFNIGDLSITFA
jgi:hypothetical protein